MGNGQGKDLLNLWDPKGDKWSKPTIIIWGKFFKQRYLPRSGWDGALGFRVAQGELAQERLSFQTEKKMQQEDCKILIAELEHEQRANIRFYTNLEAELGNGDAW